MTTAATVTTVSTSDAQRAAATITSAFIADPFFRWAFPDAGQYLNSFPRLIEAYCGSGITNGTAYSLSDFAGAAIWLAPGATPDEEAVGALLEETVDPERLRDVFGVLEEMGSYHPDDEPLWYLPFIGVDPINQGQGLGSILMRHALELCDEQGLRAYLESSNPVNIPFYERLGFEVMGKIEVSGAPVVTPMIREKR